MNNVHISFSFVISFPDLFMLRLDDVLILGGP